MKMETKADVLKVGVSMIFGGGFLCLFIITAIVGIPIMIIGFIYVIMSFFWNPESSWMRPFWERKQKVTPKN